MTNALFQSTPRQLNAALVLLRIGAGVVFAAHGWQKLFVFGFAGVQGAFGQMGVPMPDVTAPLVALVELLGGIALVLGLLTRPAAFGLAVTMLGALFMVHLPGGFFMPNGIEFVLTLFAAAAALVVAGGGGYSIDALLASRTSSAQGKLSTR